MAALSRLGLGLGYVITDCDEKIESGMRQLATDFKLRRQLTRAMRKTVPDNGARRIVEALAG